jgi:D-alanine-D-alanine ligase
MNPSLAACVGARRKILQARAPRTALLTGPASPEDQHYFARTDPQRLSQLDIAAALGRLEVPAVSVIDISAGPRWIGQLDNIDLVIINLHGAPGEDGSVQGVLQELGLPFVGSSIEASVVGLNKFLCKLMAQHVLVPTPGFRMSGPTAIGSSAGPGDGPRALVAKPLRGGGSMGIRTLERGDTAPPDGEWIIEDLVAGTDVTVTVIDGLGGPLALPAVVLDHGPGMYDEEAKMRSREDRARGLRPAGLRPALARSEQLAVRMHRALQARHISRSDFVVHGDEVYFLEINTIPGLSSGSNCMECAHAAGLNYDDLIALVVGAALT